MGSTRYQSLVLVVHSDDEALFALMFSRARFAILRERSIFREVLLLCFLLHAALLMLLQIAPDASLLAFLTCFECSVVYHCLRLCSRRCNHGMIVLNVLVQFVAVPVAFSLFARGCRRLDFGNGCV
jgi:hypothetical protein